MFTQRQTNIGNIARDPQAMAYVVTRTPDCNNSLEGQSYPTLVLRVRTRGTSVTLPLLTKSSVDRGESYPTEVGLLDVMRTAS